MLSPVIDTHCHLADKKFSADLPEVLRRAKSAGVTRLITIGDLIEESERCLEIAERGEQLYCTVGVHPHNAKTWRDGDVERLRALCVRSKNAIAIGEIGLDYHYDLSPRRTQQEVFREQLILANDLGLPAVVHNREAITDLRTIIEEVSPLKLVLHCCTERYDDVAWLVERGYFLSFTGIATYADADHVRETIRRCPPGQLMLETDAPYLAPVPFRGKRNEPAYVVEVAKAVADVTGIPLEDIDRTTTRNAIEFFSLPQ